MTATPAALRFAVVGDPVAHTRSPVMHAAAFATLGLPHVYEAVRATPEDLPRVVAALRAGDYAGLNVTIPHKRAVLACVDHVDESARRAGAANTLARDASTGAVTAHNTDAPALARELADLAGSGAAWSDRRCLVLGSGGAARAAVAALGRLGVRDVRLRARRPDAALAPLDRWQALAPSSASESTTLVVVQATSAGMTGADPGDGVARAVAWEALPADAAALDVVYAPEVTPFLSAARRRGLRTAGGLGMLARQGALALELWLGIEAPFEAMLAALDVT